MRITSNISPVYPLYSGKIERGLLWYYCWSSLLADIVCFSLKRSSIRAFWVDDLFIAVEFLFIATYLNKEIFSDSVSRVALPITWVISGILLTNVFYGLCPVKNLELAGILYGYYIVLLLVGFGKIIREMKYEFVQYSPFSSFAPDFFFMPVDPV